MTQVRELAPPFLNAHFRLLIDGLTMADFAECGGLEGEIGVEEYAEGGENRFTHRFPSRRSSPNLVLRRGSTADTSLWDWYAEYVERGEVAPRDGQVQVLSSVDGQPQPVRVWAFRRGFPVKISGADLNAAAAAVAIETIEIAHHGLSVVDLPT